MEDKKETVSPEILKQKSSELSALLSKQDMSEEEKRICSDIISQYPRILSWKDFSADLALPDLMELHKQGKTTSELIEQSSQALTKSKTVLDNLNVISESGAVEGFDNLSGYAIDGGYSPNGETLGTQTVKNINFLQSLSQEDTLAGEEKSLISKHLNQDYKVFLQEMYDNGGAYNANKGAANLQGQKVANLVEDIVKERQSIQVEKLPSKESPRKTLTIEELKDRAYQGTLTVEQAEQLRKKDDDKKIADMASIPGDRKKTKHDSNDKFKDEDVIKYMYEDWFLGGMQWVFNKIENITLDTIDSAIEIYTQRAAGRKDKNEKDRNSRLGQASQQADNFANMVQGSINNFGSACQAKTEAYQSIFDDLRKNLNNPNPDWKHFDGNDPFIKQLESNPEQARQFMEKSLPMLQNMTKSIESIGKVSMLIASIQMTDEFMSDDRAWKQGGKYKDEEKQKKELLKRSQINQKNIMHAIAVISEDSRLLAEYEYDKLSGNKPDFNEFRQQYINREVNKFLNDLASQTKDLSERQNKDLKAKNFESIGKKVHRDYGVDIGLQKLNNFIQKTISKGSIYKSNLFSNEKSEERISLQRGLLEEAIQINSPNNMENTLKKLKEMNFYDQQVFDERRHNTEGRKSLVEEFKKKLSKRDNVPPVEILKSKQASKYDK